VNLYVLCSCILILKRGGLSLIPCDICAEGSGAGTFISECFRFTLSVSFFQCSVLFFILRLFCQKDKRTTKQRC